MSRQLSALLFVAVFVLLMASSSPSASSVRVNSRASSGLSALQSDFERFAVRSSRGRASRHGRGLLQSDVLSCSGNTTQCGSLCTNTDFDSYNCGACNKYCDMDKDCCLGVCVDLQTDNNHCGSCGAVCESGCEAGTCAYSMVDSIPEARR